MSAFPVFDDNLESMQSFDKYFLISFSFALFEFFGVCSVELDLVWVVSLGIILPLSSDLVIACLFCEPQLFESSFILFFWEFYFGDVLF